MASDASAALGAPQLGGTFVSPKGLTKKMTAATAGGLVGGIAGRVAGDTLFGSAGAPDFGSLGYVAATATEVAIVKGKAGLMKPSVTDMVIERAPRDQITAVELDGKMLTAALKISFVGGGSWEFEVPKVHRGNAERLVAVLSQTG